MTNRVDIEVTGSNKFDATQASVNRNLRSIETQANKTTAASKRLNTALDDKPKMDGAKEAEKAIKKLEGTADDAFGKIKKKMNDSFDKLEKEHEVKIKTKVDIDKNSVRGALDSIDLGGDKAGKGFGSKIRAMFGKSIDLTGAGVGAATSFVGGLGDGLKAQHPVVRATVYAALAGAVLTAGPFLGSVLAGGLIAGFGAGLAGIGIVAASQSDRVKSVWKDLWDEIVAGTRAKSGAIEVVLMNTAGRAKTVWTKMSTDLAGALNDIAPGLEKLLDGVLQGLGRFTPALRPIAEAASAVFSDIGSRLPDIIGGMADSFADLAREVKKNPQALGDLIALMGQIVEIGAGVIGFFTDWRQNLAEVAKALGQPAIANALTAMDAASKKSAESLNSTNDKLSKMSDVTGTATDKVAGIEQAFSDLADAEDDAAKRGDAFLDIMNKLAGRAPTFEDSVKDTNDTIRDLIDNFTKSGAAADGYGKDLLKADGSINTMTANGSKLYDALSSLQENFADAAGATKELEAAGMSHDEAVKKVNDTLATQSQRLLDAAGKMGLNQDQMRELLRLYGLTPQQIATLLKLDDADFRARMAENLRAKALRIDVVYNNLNAPLTRGTGRTYGVTDYAAGGALTNAAAGGVRSNEVRINDGPGGYPGEAVRMPNGSMVMPAGMTRMMMQQASRGFGNAMGGGGGTRTLEWIGPPDIIAWLKTMIRENGGDASVLGGGA